MSELLRFPRVIILMILFSFLSLAAVVFTPAYPELADRFQLADSQTQWVMTIFLLGTAIGRLPYGPLANRIGRKKTLMWGLFVSLIGTVMILSADSYLFLCFGRFVQGLGCAVTLKIGYTMVGDLHQGPAATRVLSYAMLAYAVLPGIGASIAGFLVESYGWQGGFWFFLIFTIVVMISCLSLPETSKGNDLKALNVRRIAKAYAKQFKNKSLLICGALMGLSTAVLFVFSQEAPFIAIEMIGITPQEYGMYYLIPAFGIAGGSFATIWLAEKISASSAMLLGIGLIGLASLAMGLLLANWVSPWALFLPQVVIQLGDAILYTNASSSTLSDAEDKSNASAVVLFLSSFSAVVGTFLVGIFVTRSFWSIPIVFLIMTGLMLIFWLIQYRPQQAST